MTLTAHQRPHRGATDVWLTPPEIVDALGPFDLDPCAAPRPRPWPTAARHITLPDDGLTASWSSWAGRDFIWCNPPFGPDAGRWLARMADHHYGVALVAARTETRWWIDHVWTQATSMLFLHGRPHFHHWTGRRGRANSGAPITLVAYGPEAHRRLMRSGLPGHLVTDRRLITRRDTATAQPGEAA